MPWNKLVKSGIHVSARTGSQSSAPVILSERERQSRECAVEGPRESVRHDAASGNSHQTVLAAGWSLQRGREFIRAALLLLGALLLSGAKAERQLPSTPASPSQRTEATPDINQARAAPAPFVMIDPGHGGDDKGVLLSDKLAEKDVTLALAHRLKAELQEKGIVAHLLRDGDITLTLAQRAEAANEQHAALYVSLHAGAPGHGIRVYSPANVSAGVASAGKFLPWDNVQANYISRSDALAKAIAGALARKNLTASTLSTPLRPLNNINAPAIAVELALDSSNPQDVMGQKFQTQVASAVAAEIAQQRNQWEKQP